MADWHDTLLKEKAKEAADEMRLQRCLIHENLATLRLSAQAVAPGRKVPRGAIERRIRQHLRKVSPYRLRHAL